MLGWWTSEEQAKQSPPDEEEGIDSGKGSWAAGTELHAYDMFGRIEAVRRESGLPVRAAIPTDCSFCTVGILSWRQKPEQCRQWSDRSSVREIWALSWREQNHAGNCKSSVFTLQRSSSCFHGVWNGKNWNLNLKPKLCFIINILEFPYRFSEN